MSKLNESLLEMIYFFPMKAEFEYILGKKINAIYKPSQQKEAWLGFDQAWISDEIKEDEFYDFIKKKSKKTKFIAYIMQFKIVNKQKYYSKRKRKFTVPSHYKEGEIYYKSPLKTVASLTTSDSQHEILYNLKKHHNFLDVCYVCPMIFSQSDIFHPKLMKDEKEFRKHILEKLVIVDVSTAPDPSTTSWDPSDNHHIIWNENAMNVIHWCSDPQEGTSEKYSSWVENLSNRILSAEELIDTIKRIKSSMPIETDKQQAFKDIFSKMTILKIED
ncbi:hypothetical protein Plano_0554 [Planococcus sp. PAMC 21323]|uniref:hypothetical protein n=1 Tax=Planococcus sp. PAMC 21323 TaxID=1526927 RepID=UPI0005700074|nr:hypothetical protein [Planococcus sp. PAMC 21323]AIY04519.1 hypothetical protein Plano_0554 [Planococcus sp. PAMC 21323]